MSGRDSRTRDIGCTYDQMIVGCVIHCILIPAPGLSVSDCRDSRTRDRVCGATRRLLAVLFSGNVLILALDSFTVMECHNSGTKDTLCSATRRLLAVLFSGDVLILALDSLSRNAITEEQKTHGAVQPGSGWLCYLVEMS